MRGPEGRLSSMAESDLSSTLPCLSVRVRTPTAWLPFTGKAGMTAVSLEGTQLAARNRNNKAFRQVMG